MVELLKKVDQRVHQAERVIIAVSLSIMSAVVFLDVVHRVFADEESKFAALLVKFLGIFGVDDGIRGPLYQSLRDYVTMPFLGVFFVALAYFGLTTAYKDKDFSVGKRFGIAIGVIFGTWVVIKLFILLFPNGVIWAQTLALILTLWVGFVGASMCTYEGKHLSVEVADKIWPEKFKPFINGISNLITAGFVFFLFGLAIMEIQFNYEEYAMTDGQGGVHEGLPGLPLWIAYLVLPMSFLIMGLRFVAASVAAFTGGSYGKHQSEADLLTAEHEAELAAEGGEAAGTGDAFEDARLAAPDDESEEGVYADDDTAMGSREELIAAGELDAEPDEPDDEKDDDGEDRS